MYEYFVFQGQTDITDHQRTQLFLALSAAGLLGVLMLFFLRTKPPTIDMTDEDGEMSINAV